MKFRRLSLAAAGAIAVAAACGGSPTGPRPLPPPPEDGPPRALQVDTPYFVPGEVMEWELSWKGITGGKTMLAVGDPGSIDGQPAIIIRSETRSDGLLAMFRHVRDHLTTTVSLDGSRPLESHGTFEFGKRGDDVRHTTVDATFSDGKYELRYERKGRPELKWTQDLPRGEFAYDTHAVLGALRAWQPVDGERAYFYALSGRRLYRVDLAMAGREPVKVGIGQFAALRIEGTAYRLTRAVTRDGKRSPRHFTLWLSDDANRVPVRIEARTEYGDVLVELVGYERGPSLPVASR